MFRKIIRVLLKLIVVLFTTSVTFVFIYKVLPLPLTPVMLGRVAEGIFECKLIGINKTWTEYDEISPHVFRAFIASEDARFLKHNGIDWKAVEQAQRYNKLYQGRKKRGASTISMQTAKNAFLFHSRNYLRKALEVYFTFLIEPVWGKKRILEVYANIIEFGDGIYGVEQASLTFFNKPANKLTKRESSILAAVLPNPHRWSPAKPTKYILKRAGFIRSRMGSIALPKE
ncbi:monofunctional biosynthetic peptidoglycan transglycosylase [Bacteroidota bacterium]